MDVKEKTHDFHFTYGDDGDDEQVCAVRFTQYCTVPYLGSFVSVFLFWVSECCMSLCSDSCDGLFRRPVTEEGSRLHSTAGRSIGYLRGDRFASAYASMRLLQHRASFIGMCHACQSSAAAVATAFDSPLEPRTRIR